MSPRWLKFLKKFGLRGKSLPNSLEEEDLDAALDSSSSFKSYDVLFHLYGPLESSPWVPYHCPTLFASIDRLHISVMNRELSSVYTTERPSTAWQWVEPQTMIIVDLPGTTTIEVGVLLMKQGAQFVSTFDHWPSSPRDTLAREAIKSTPLIDTMYTLAPEVYEVMKDLSPHAPPIWLCDSRRLGGSIEPSPGTFDNRYFIDDSIIPGIKTLKKNGIRKVVYFQENLQHQPLPDLVPFMIQAHKAGIELQQVALTKEDTWSQPVTMDVPFETKLPIKGFRRSDMGGFGRMVPEPSEGGYGSGGGGG